MKIGPKSSVETPSSSEQIGSARKEEVAEDQFVSTPPPPAIPSPSTPELRNRLPALGDDSHLGAFLGQLGLLPADSRITQREVNDLVLDPHFSVTALSKRDDLDFLMNDLQKASDSHKGRLHISDLLTQLAQAKSLKEQLQQRPELKKISQDSYLVKLLGDIREVTGHTVFAKIAMDRLLKDKRFQVESLSKRPDLSQLREDLKNVNDAHHGGIDLSPLLACVDEAAVSRQKRLQLFHSSAAGVIDPIMEERKQNAAEIYAELAKSAPDTFRIADLAEKGATLPPVVDGIDVAGTRELNALQIAAQRGQRNAVKTLLAAGAKPNLLSNDKSVLELAILADQPAVIPELLAKGADANRANRQGMTPLHLAASLGSHYAINYLLQHGATPNARNAEGKTPAQVASDPETTKLLRNARPKPG